MPLAGDGPDWRINSTQLEEAIKDFFLENEDLSSDTALGLASDLLEEIEELAEEIECTEH